MTNYREILRLHSLGYSKRRIEASVRSSHQTVKQVIDSTEQNGIKWPLDEDITNAKLKKLLSGKDINYQIKIYADPNYPYIHRKLSKKGELWLCCGMSIAKDVTLMVKLRTMSTQFSDNYRRLASVSKATMRINHKPGETMQVDWAGEAIPYYDSVTGEEYKANLFVAVLPCSSIIYVEACEDMKQENWLLFSYTC